MNQGSAIDRLEAVLAEVEALLGQARGNEAVALVQAAIADAPCDLDVVDRLLGLGLVAPARDLALRAAQERPDDSEAHLAAARCHVRRNRADLAIPHLRRVCELEPDEAAHAYNLATMLLQDNQAEEARAVLTASATRLGRPGHRVSAGTALDVIPASRLAIAQSRARFLEALTSAAHIDDPFQELCLNPFFLAYHAADNRPLFEALSTFMAASCPVLSWRAPHLGRMAPPVGRRLRLGIFSVFLYGHTIGLLNRGLITGLDRSRFEVIVIARRVPGDFIQAEIEAAADAVVWIDEIGSLASFLAAREAIAAQELDILVYADIGMSAGSRFMSMARLAPVQAVSIGHPDTTGSASLDLFLSHDSMEPPDGESHYAESLVRLPGPFPCYPRPAFAPAALSRADFGLAEDENCYLVPQSLFKLHPDFDDALIRIVAADPRAVIVLIADVKESFNQAVVDRLERTCHGSSGRLRFVTRMPIDTLLRLMQLADVVLDPLHYSGGNTSLEIFSVGTPIVTWPGRFMRGRVTYGFYLAMGIFDAIARDFDHYVELALRFGRDREAAADLRRRILAANGALYDNPTALRAMEDRLEHAMLSLYSASLRGQSLGED